MQLKSQPPTAIQACQHAAHCGRKTQCFCQGGLLQSQAVIYTLQFQDCGKHPQSSPLSIVKLLSETFCFSARTKTWFVLIWEKKNRQKEKRREVKDLQVPSFFIKKKKITAKTAKPPLPLLSNVKTKQKGSQDLRWKTWKNKQSKKPLLSISKSFFLALEYILWKPGKTGTCTIHHVRLSKHT